LLSEALRGEGARLINADGDAFMARVDPDGDLAPRDRVARAIVRESERTGKPVYLTLAHLPAATIRSRFPLITELCRRVGLDVATDRLPVSPAAHYVMGGVQTDLDGRTSIPGLYAAGEAACTGVHGANRLASNSLLEGLVFGGRAAEAMLRDAVNPGTGGARGHDPAPVANRLSAPIDTASIADLMWRHVGVFRDRDSLQEALATLDPVWASLDADLRAGRSADAVGWQARSVLIVARLITRAALRREESRGAHYRRDFPHKDEVHWLRHTTETRE
jgi:L-aspartate oxidase